MRKALLLFGRLTDDDVEWLGRVGRVRRLEDGETLITATAAPEALFVVLDGHLTIATPDGTAIARRGAGEVLGELSFIDSRPPSAEVIASGAAAVLAVDRAEIARRLDSDPGFAARFYLAIATFLASRLRGTMHHLGYGPENGVDEDAVQAQEVDPAVLDGLASAGARFDRLAKQMLIAHDRAD